MADDQGQERSERPTPKRLTEARERGQVAKSSDLSAAVSLLIALVLLKLFGLHLVSRWAGTLRYYLSSTPVPLNADHLDKVMMRLLRALLETSAPLLVLMGAGVLAAVFAQVGFLFTFKTLEIKLARLNPLSGMRRLFGLQSLVKLGMGLLKMSVVIAVAYPTISGQVAAITGASALTYRGVLSLGADMVFELGLRLGLALLFLGLLDYAYQRWRHIEKLKMTKQEVKEEMRQMEGDPVIKRRQRNVQFQLALQRIRNSVPQADVVITNPTELAIALKYDAETMSAPKVIAKGRGLLAKRIREIAIEAGVPIVERKMLAQAMYKIVEIGQEIPAQFYKAVAEILAFVYELAGKGRRSGASGVPIGA
jgi:flagellar biosynthetic protein FlhB